MGEVALGLGEMMIAWWLEMERFVGRMDLFNPSVLSVLVFGRIGYIVTFPLSYVSLVLLRTLLTVSYDYAYPFAMLITL